MICTILIYSNHVFTDIEAVNNEVLTGTDAVISCKVTGITEAITVIWKTSDNEDVTSVTDTSYKYDVDVGTFNEAESSQTTTLAVKAVENTEDSTFSCQVASVEWNDVGDSTVVKLDVFGRSHFSLSRSDINILLEHFVAYLFNNMVKFYHQKIITSLFSKILPLA